MSKSKLLIIGGNAAGMSAASQARRTDPGIDITVIEQSPYISGASCGLPYFISGEIKDINSLLVRTKEYFETERNIKVLTLTKAVRIHPAAKSVDTLNLENGAKAEIRYDRLIIAAGGSAVKTDSGKGIFTLRNIGDGLALKQFIESANPLNAAVIGGGMIGLETASSFRKLGMKVTVFEGGPGILPGFDNEISGLLEKYLAKNNINVFKSKASASPSPAGGVDIKTPSGSHNYDMALLTTGTKPSAELARGAGCELGETGAVRTNQKMQTSVPSIYAAGDCVEVKHLISGKNVYMPLGTTANKTGRIAGINAAGGDERFRGITGSMAGNILDLTVAKTGLSEEEARETAGEILSTVSESTSSSGYYPGSSKITTKLIYSKISGQLLGAQMVGKNGVAKRIDVLSVCIYQKMKLRDIAGIDLTYAPPVAPVWDPVLKAVNTALLKIKK
ncbi:MAG: FAD-dependent oxidoreductase [Elusimicrobia bacterium]|nr:FAD-dependent oxidoreductase [Elusimicrobiota bacterium]